MNKTHLMAPGPTPVPERARLAMARQLIHHRSEDFEEVIAQVRRDLRWLFETEADPLLLSCSGTGAFEAAMTNFTCTDDKIIAVGGGKFGERWGDVGRSYGLEVVDVDIQWGRHLTASRLQEVLEAHPDAAMVTLTASETSTGVLHPVGKLAEVVRRDSDALFAVDAITAVGVHRLPMDELEIDVMVGGSQKAFGIPPGLGVVAAGPRAWERNEESDHPNYYFDLERERSRQSDHQTAFTSSISITLALREVLQMMREEGRDELLARHRANAAATRAGVRALGLEVLSDRHSDAVTAVCVPDGFDGGDWVDRLRRDHGVIIAGGQKHMSGSLIRIGHIGFFEPSDIRVTLGALEEVLIDEGMGVEPGAALSAAQRVFSSQDDE